MIGAQLTMLLLQALMIGVIGVMVYVRFVRMQAQRDFLRERGVDMSVSLANFVYGAIGLAICVLSLVGMAALMGTKPAAMGQRFIRAPLLSLLVLAVLCYGGLQIGLVLRQAVQAIRQIRRQRAAAQTARRPNEDTEQIQR